MAQLTYFEIKLKLIFLTPIFNNTIMVLTHFSCYVYDICHFKG